MGPEMLEGLQDESVYEHTNGVVLVVGRGYGWMISPQGARPSSEKHDQRRWDWPETHSRGARRDFNEHLANGGLFHADFCTNAGHHTWPRTSPVHTEVVPAEPAT